MCPDDFGFTDSFMFPFALSPYTAILTESYKKKLP